MKVVKCKYKTANKAKTQVKFKYRRFVLDPWKPKNC